MKRILQTKINSDISGLATLLLRITVSVFMITHAVPKVNRLLAGGEIRFPDPIGVGAITSLMMTIFAEMICSILIGFGLVTRLATIPLIIAMSIAGFVVHAGDAFKQKELALMYLVIYLFLLINGSGKYSVDYFMSGKK